ncbi:MAG: hypothetical protein ACK4NS_08615 [Saprospiraceae bacterium]
MTVGYYHILYAEPPVGGSLKPASGFVGIGGSGFGRWGERVLIGGGGFGTVDRMVLAEGVEVQTGFGMGFFDFGYVLRDKGRNLIFGFAGIGGGGSDLTYGNTGVAPVAVQNVGVLAPGERAKVNSGGLGWELGLSLNRLLFDPEKSGGGFSAGLDLGMAMLPAASRWKRETAGGETPVGQDGRPMQTVFYVRMTIGGGMFR